MGTSHKQNGTYERLFHSLRVPISAIGSEASAVALHKSAFGDKVDFMVPVTLVT